MLSDKLTLQLVSDERKNIEKVSAEYEYILNQLFSWWMNRKQKPEGTNTDISYTDHQFIFVADYRVNPDTLDTLCKDAEKEGFEVKRYTEKKKVVITNHKSYNACCELYTKLGLTYSQQLVSFDDPPTSTPKEDPTSFSTPNVDFTVLVQNDYTSGLACRLFKYLCW